MPRKCVFCLSPQRASLEQQIAGRQITQKRAASEILHVNPSAVSRHMLNHLAPAVRESLQRDVDSKGVYNVVQELVDMYQLVQDLVEKARKEGNIVLALQALGTGRKIIELYAKLTGQLPYRPENAQQRSSWNDPTTIRMTQIILKATEEYPELQKELSDAFNSLEDD